MSEMIDKTVRNSAAIDSPGFALTQSMDHSLKGLLMDKGGRGLELKIHTCLRNIELVQNAMETLVVQQRYSREESGCDCLDLYLARNLKIGGILDANAIREMSLRDIQLHYSKGAACLEWRARPSFAGIYGYRNTKRMYPFIRGNEHVAQVRKYVDRVSPRYYQVMAGYDAVKVSLNGSMRSLRKTLLDLHSISQETVYPRDIERDAENLSKRFFKQLPNSLAVAHVLNQLYC